MLHLSKEIFSESSRAAHAYKKYKSYFGKSILDVGAGGSANYFRTKLGTAYKAADVSQARNQPDYFIDFEKGNLPFKDNEFETVLSFDNLEHCENCHELFDELVRISSKHVIIALPNNWPTFWKSLIAGHNISHKVGYGLPAEKPAPGIRHKWFFNLEEAEKFIVGRAQKLNIKVVRIDYVYEAGFTLIHIPVLYPGIFRIQPQHIQRLLELSDSDKNKFGAKALLAQKVIKALGPNVAKFALYLAKTVTLPFWVIDEFIKHLIWGWGSKYRYLNMFCRQIWVVLEKN